MQFDERCPRYHCCCECCHVKTAVMVVCVAELLFVGFFFVNSLVLISTSRKLNAEIEVPFFACLVGLALALLVVLLAFAAVVNKKPCLLVPHLVLQLTVIPVLLAVLVMGALALLSERVLFYRLLNAVSFSAPDGERTVSLAVREKSWLCLLLSLYLILLLLELWFTWLFWRCFVYLRDKSDYIRHCRAYCAPMNSVSRAAAGDHHHRHHHLHQAPLAAPLRLDEATPVPNPPHNHYTQRNPYAVY